MELGRRELWLDPCWAFLRLEKVSGGQTKGEGAEQSSFSPQFLSLGLPPHCHLYAVPRGAHLVQALAAQVAHGLLNALWQRLACTLHMDERWHPKHVLAPVVWGFVPFHEFGH